MKKKALLLMLFLMLISTNALSQNTIYGNVSGDVQEGVTVEIYTTSCGSNILEATTETDVNGYYSFGGLNSQRYLILAEEIGYSFVPASAWVDIPQTEVQSYDFTATGTSCASVDRFLDNSDGTVTDCRTGLVWLKNANCYGSYMSWQNAKAFANVLKNGWCELSDGSMRGDWRLPDIEELIDIGGGDKDNLNAIINSDFFTDHFIINNWTKPGLPFIEVQNAYHPLNDNPYVGKRAKYCFRDNELVRCRVGSK
jgi:hypothetical protein